MKKNPFVLISLNLFFLLSLEAHSESFSSLCPNKFQVELSGIQPVTITEKIHTRPFLLHAYNSSKNTAAIRKTFSILTRTKENLCVYSDHSQSALLQLNNKKAELVVGLSPYLYLRVPMVSFNKEHFAIKNLSALKEILGADFEIDSDGGTLFKDEAVLATAIRASLRVIP